MPAEELAPCGFGAFGTCCCTCANHLKLVDRCTHIGGSRKCGEYPDGEFVCLVFAPEFAEKWKEHGMCEGHLEREIDGTRHCPVYPEINS